MYKASRPPLSCKIQGGAGARHFTGRASGQRGLELEFAMSGRLCLREVGMGILAWATDTIAVFYLLFVWVDMRMRAILTALHVRYLL